MLLTCCSAVSPRTVLGACMRGETSLHIRTHTHTHEKRKFELPPLLLTHPGHCAYQRGKWNSSSHFCRRRRLSVVGHVVRSFCWGTHCSCFSVCLYLGCWWYTSSILTFVCVCSNIFAYIIVDAFTYCSDCRSKPLNWLNELPILRRTFQQQQQCFLHTHCYCIGSSRGETKGLGSEWAAND